MPGIYSRPPRRAEFAADVRCLLSAADELFALGDLWEGHVHLLADSIEAELQTAREEALRDHKEGAETRKGQQEARKEKMQMQQLIARKHIQVAEVFFECGVHQLFCKILKENSLNASCAALERILGVYQLFSVMEVDPFDDDMGVVSVLNYFLSERHSFYVDINWLDAQLQHMQLFLSAFLAFNAFPLPVQTPPSMSPPSTASRGSTEAAEEETENELQDKGKSVQEHLTAREKQMQLKVTALRILHAALRTFPPHRVVSQMAFCFSRVRCSEFLNGLCDMLSSSSPPQPELISLQLRTTAAVAAFGIGPSISRRAVRAALCWSSATFACREERCPCSCCEFDRRLLKLLRRRDELGVIRSAEAKRQICLSLIRGGLPQFLVQLLKATKKAAGESKESLADNTLESLSWVLLLCSWAYEDAHQGESILSANSFLLTQLLLDLLDPSNSPAAAKLLDLGGASSLLRVFIALVLRAKDEERKVLMNLCRETCWRIAICLHTALLQVHPADRSEALKDKDSQRNVPPNGDSIPDQNSSLPVDSSARDPAEKALNTSLLLFSLAELLLDPKTNETPTKHDQEQKQQVQVLEKQQVQQQKEQQQPVAIMLDALNALSSLFEYLMPRFSDLLEKKKGEEEEVSNMKTREDFQREPPHEVVGPAGFEPREFFLGVFGLMAVLVGALKLQGIEQLRWRLVSSPVAAVSPAAEGTLAPTARMLLAHYQKLENERCEVVKKFATLTILRSEQAAGLVLRGRHPSEKRAEEQSNK